MADVTVDLGTCKCGKRAVRQCVPCGTGVCLDHLDPDRPAMIRCRYADGTGCWKARQQPYYGPEYETHWFDWDAVVAAAARPAMWLIVIAIVLLLFSWRSTFFVRDDVALAQFQSLYPDKHVEIVTHSNNVPFFGNTDRVIYVLLVDGREARGVCETSNFSTQICRTYNGD